jgi:hypothetical protein
MCMCGVMAWICPILKLSVLYNNGYYLGVKLSFELRNWWQGK